MWQVALLADSICNVMYPGGELVVMGLIFLAVHLQVEVAVLELSILVSSTGPLLKICWFGP